MAILIMRVFVPTPGFGSADSLQTMLVAVDARALAARRGVARYTRRMLEALAAPGTDVVCALLPGRAPVEPVPGVSLARTAAPSRLVHGAGALLGRPRIGRLATRGDEPGITWLPAPVPVAVGDPYVLTVHDLSWLERPQDFTPYERAWHRLMRPGALVRGAARVVVDAEPVAAQVARRWGVEATVVEPGVDHRPATPHPGTYVLYVGALEPRKGLDVLAEAWARTSLPAELLVVGEGRVAVPGARMLGHVDDEALHALYAGALAVVLPSRLEGYGLPPREAAAHGVPSIVSDLPTLRLARAAAATHLGAGRRRAAHRARRGRRRMSGLTVVCVLHDSAADLRRLLASLEPMRPAVIAVDAGSGDDGPEVAAAWGAAVVEAGDVGFGAANNAGLAHVRTSVTLLLNPDVVVRDPAVLERLARHARRQDALHAPRLLNPDGSVQRSAHPVPGRISALLPAAVPPRVLPPSLRLEAEPWRSERERPVGWAIAAALAARTDTLRRLGPFDPGQFLFFEDLDLCLRARAAGVPTILHPDLALEHRGGHSTGPAYDGEPYTLLARRRREVIGERLGPRALRADDAAQALTFATRALARRALGRDARRERAQLAALRAARRTASVHSPGH
jgi:GT2 family glycosyltransferase